MGNLTRARILLSMLRRSSSWMGNLTRARILLSTSQEMVKKKIQVREKSGNFTLSQGKFFFKRNEQKLDFFNQFKYFSRFL